MKIINDDGMFVYITVNEKEILKVKSREVCFVDEKVFKFVETYVSTNKIKPSEKYWEENWHDRHVDFLERISNFSRSQLSNALSALGV